MGELIKELLSITFVRSIIIGVCLGGLFGCISHALNNAKGGK